MRNRLCLSFFILLLASEAWAQSALEIIDQYLDTVSYGDVGKWDRVKTFFSVSVGTYGEDHEVSYKKTFKAWSGKMKEELYSDSSLTRLTTEVLFLNDKKYVRIGNLPEMIAYGDNSMWLDFLPVIVQDHAKKSKAISYNGIKTLPGLSGSLHEIEMQSATNIRRFYFNTTTHLLEAIGFGENKIFWFYQEYKDVDGYLLPQCIGSSDNGRVFSTTCYKKMEFNQPIDPNLFKP